MLIPAVSAAISVESVYVDREGNSIVFYAKISGSSPENLSVRLYYIFDQDIGTEDNPTPPQVAYMHYNSETGYWVANITKKYDASKLHYYLEIHDAGTGEDLRTEPAEYAYTTPLDFKYPGYIAVLILLFAGFELLMHYGRKRDRILENPDIEPEEEDEKDREEEEKKGGS